MSKFHPRFDYVILLTASTAVMAERLSARAGNAYGKRPAQLARILAQRDVIEPRLRKISDHEIDSNAPMDEVVHSFLDIVQ